MEKNSRKISDIYFDLFDIMMTYNHKLWRTAALPLPLNHFAVMYYLFEKEDTFATVTELAKHLSISKQQMSPIIDKLVKKEFIKKTCLSKDRRYSQISLSLTFARTISFCFWFAGMPIFAWTILFFSSSGSLYTKYFLTASAFTGDGKSSPSMVVNNKAPPEKTFLTTNGPS